MPAGHLVHHLGVFASDFAASESFYTSALAALDVRAGHRTDTVAEYWIPADDAPSLSLKSAQTSAEVTRGLHLAFEAADRSSVDAFHRAAVAAGGTSRHEPSPLARVQGVRRVRHRPRWKQRRGSGEGGRSSLTWLLMSG